MLTIELVIKVIYLYITVHLRIDTIKGEYQLHVNITDTCYFWSGHVKLL
jgi:hypothetical protein